MTILTALLARWRTLLPLAAVLAVMALLAVTAHYRSAYRAERAGRTADRAAYAAAQDEAARIARAALAHQEAVYTAKAQDADHAYTLALADARNATDRFIAANRLRVQAVAGAARPAALVASGDGAQLPASLPADAVMVSDRDVRACTDATAYAIAAHDWALSLEPSK